MDEHDKKVKLLGYQYWQLGVTMYLFNLENATAMHISRARKRLATRYVLAWFARRITQPLDDIDQQVDALLLDIGGFATVEERAAKALVMEDLLVNHAPKSLLAYLADNNGDSIEGDWSVKPMNGASRKNRIYIATKGEAYGEGHKAKSARLDAIFRYHFSE